MMQIQLAAYLLVLAFWALPIPNPVKLLALTFHEMSHAWAALLTGGRVFGFAIDPAGAGVTIGIGGDMFIILIAGYIGSCLWGAALHYASVKWDSRYALLSLVCVILASSGFWWLTRQTAFFGVGSMFLLAGVFRFGDLGRRFFLQLVGSACCLYAPLEVLGEVFRVGAC
jgi:hypothetical protein